jgi:hypothetical protein
VELHQNLIGLKIIEPKVDRKHIIQVFRVFVIDLDMRLALTNQLFDVRLQGSFHHNWVIVKLL